jgi:flagellar motor switch protein FliM
MKAATGEQAQIRRLDLTGPERRLGSAVRALGQIAERFCKGARRSMPFLSRQKARVVAGEVSLGSPPGDHDVAEGPGYRVSLESADGHAWGIVRLDTGAIALILDGTLGGSPSVKLDLEEVFGKELTGAQKALVGKVAAAIAEDFAVAVRSVSELELRPVSAESMRGGEELELPKDAISVDCGFDGVATPGVIQLIAGAEVLEAAVQAQVDLDAVTGDPKMAQAVRGVSVQVVAELGRLELGLGRVLALSKGETLRLSTAVEEPITLRVAGMAKFDAVPVISRGQLSVQIKGRRSE